MATRTPRRWPYLVVAAVLLAAGAWLTSGGEAPKPSVKPDVKMPRRATPDERERAASRRTLTEEPLAQPRMPDAPPPRPRDPMLVAMPAEVKAGAVVVEANALRNSDLSEAMLACLMSGSRGPQTLGRIRDAGFDPLTQLDRVAMFDDTLMMTGDFSGVTFPDTVPTDFGGAKLYTNEKRPGNSYALWKGQALLIGSPDELKQAIDRLDGKTPPPTKPLFDDSMAYGELYGVLKPDALAKLFEEQDPKLAEFIRGAAQSVSLHVDAMHDVGVVADVKGGDPAQVDELRRLMGGAIAAARARAVAQGKTEQADVLDLSRVMAAGKDGKAFTFELGLPYEMLKGQLEKCVANNQKRVREEVEPAADAGL